MFSTAPAAVVALVPPLAMGSLPVTPGRGDAFSTVSADVLARFVSIDGLAVTPVPPFATGSVPVTPGRGLALSTVSAVVEPKLVRSDGEASSPVPPRATGSVPLVTSDVACVCDVFALPARSVIFA